MFHFFYVLSFFKKGDIIQEGTLFKGGHYSRKYGNSMRPHIDNLFLNLQNYKKKSFET